MRSLRDVLQDVSSRGIALGHFNIADIAQYKAVAAAAKKLSLPVVIGTSEGEREFIGLSVAIALRDGARAEGVEMFLNADHTHSAEKARQAIDAGYDEVLFDGGKLPWEENVRAAREVAEYARASGRDVVIEGELGYIGSSSEVRTELPEGAAVRPEDLTAPEEARAFAEATGIDLLAPAVGNIHGMFANAAEPALDIARIAAIAEAAGVPLVLHGASGNTDRDISAAIRAGMRIVHVSTELRVAWRRGLEESLRANPREVAPYKIFQSGIEAVEEVAEKKLRLFSGI